MISKILDLHNKPKGEAVVLNDQPKQHSYVAVLLDVQEPTDDEFSPSIRVARPACLAVAIRC